jgi:hypothetical protein
MNGTLPNEILEEVWKAKDSLSARYGHDLAATCRALYAQQDQHPERFVNLGAPKKAQSGSGRGDGIAPVTPPTPPDMPFSASGG